MPSTVDTYIILVTSLYLTFLKEPELINLFQVLLFLICAQFNSSQYRKYLNGSICAMDRAFTVTVTLGQSGPRSNDNKGVLNIP